MKPFPKQPANVLFPRLDTFGDIILIKGFLDAFMTRYPEANITLLVRNGYDTLQPLFNPRIKWLTTGADGAEPIDGANKDEAVRLLVCLQRNDYDVVLTTSYDRTWLNDTVSAILPGAVRVAIGKSEKTPRWIRAFWTEVGILEENPYDLIIPMDRFTREIEKYRILWTHISGEEEPLLPKISMTNDIASKASDILRGLGLEDSAYCICAPAGTVNVPIKAWPESEFAEVLSFLEKAYSLPAILVGSFAEKDRIEEVQRCTVRKGGAPSIWIGGDGEIMIAAALLKGARVYLGNDTGLMHLAAALGVDVAGIFGGGTWPRFLPSGNAVAVVHEMPCFGCDWNCMFQDAPCLKMIGSQDVQKGIETILNGNADRSERCRIIQSDVPYDTVLAEICTCAMRWKTACAQTQFSLDRISAENEKLKQTNSAISAQLSLCKRATNEILSSYSWVLTKPLRYLAKPFFKRKQPHS